jgi:hypothetical protein
MRAGGDEKQNGVESVGAPTDLTSVRFRADTIRRAAIVFFVDPDRARYRTHDALEEF